MARIREVLVVAHAHHDLGYTHSPRIVMPLHWQAVREAIRLAGLSDVADPAAFRWTLENARPLVEFLRHAEPDEVAALGSCAHGGLLSVTGGYLNSTQLVGHEELTRSFEWVDRFRRIGLPVRVVQHSDINGLPWGTVAAMVRAKLDILVMALNPNHGGPPFEQPSAFWWEAPDGSRVLAWLSVHYGLAEMWGLLDDDIDRFALQLGELVTRVEERDEYPFDFLVLHATDDNGWPTLHAADGVRTWNERHPELRMSTATIDGAMSRAMAQAATATLPVWRGEWADWWAHGHGSSALEVGVSRTARTLLRTAETALALARLEGGPLPPTERRTAWQRAPVRFRDEREASDSVARAWDDLLLFEEHTWGADESVSRPDSTFTRSHWNAKAEFAFSAYVDARELAGEALWRLATLQPVGQGRSLLVFNPHPEAASGPSPVEVDGTRIEILSRDVPGLGVLIVPLQEETPVTRVPGLVLETDRFRIEVDAALGGVVSLIDRSLGWELIDRSAPEPMGAVIVESVDPAVEHPVRLEGRQHFSPETPGPDFARVIAVSEAIPMIERGAGWSAISWTTSTATIPIIRTRLVVHEGLETVAMSVSMTKDEKRAPEGVYVAFPFALAGPTFQLETAGAVFRPEVEQLPGTCRDWYSVQHAVGITDGQMSVLWTTHEAPLVQLGGIHTGQWAKHLVTPVGHLYAWLMNNLYFTNFKAAQGGSMSFSFGISARAGAIDAAAVRGAGERAALPLRALVVDGRMPGKRSLLSIESPEVTAVAVALDPDGRAVRLRLQASSRGAESVTLVWHGTRRLAAWHSDVFGNRGQPVAGDGQTFALRLGPDELGTIVIEPITGETRSAHG